MSNEQDFLFDENIEPENEDVETENEQESEEFLVDCVDDAVAEQDLEMETNPEFKPGYRYSQQELIRLKKDFHNPDPAISNPAKELVFQNYKGLVSFVLTHYYSTYLANYYEDLAQQGNIGVLTGFASYDPEKDGKFYQPSTLLTRYIRHEIREYIAEAIDGTTTKYHSVGQKMVEIIRRKKAEGQDIDPGDIANELNIPLMTARHALEAIKIRTNTISLDETINDGDTKIGDITPSKIDTPEEAALKKEFEDSIANAIKLTLNPVQQRAVRLFYGFEDGDNYTMAQIAEKLNLPQEKMRKILASANNQLRSYMVSNASFTEEKRRRGNQQSYFVTTKRSDEDLRREIESFDFSSLTGL